MSVGCLKCGASDHVATNRNCPRPRRTAPVAYGVPILPLSIKKPPARSPKKPATDNHHLKEAKIGDSTKFWYYISDDSEDGTQSVPKSVKRVRVEKNGKYQEQGSAAAHDDNYGLEDNGFVAIPDLVDEAMKLDLRTRHINHKGAKEIRGCEVMTTKQETGEFIHARYGPTDSVPVTQQSGSHGKQRVQNLSEETPDPRRVHGGNGLGFIPFLPWKASDSSPLSPVKQSMHSYGNDAKTLKHKRVLKPEGVGERDQGDHETILPLQKKSCKIKQALYAMPVRATGSYESYDIQKSRYPKPSASREPDNSPQSSHQPTTNQSRYPAANPRHASQANGGRSSAQGVNDSFLAGNVEIVKFKYNYMGARNYVQEPRVRYAPDRVQGWRECRSMGTGLE